MYAHSRSREAAGDRTVTEGRSSLPQPLSFHHSPQEEMFDDSSHSPGYLSYTDGRSDSISMRLSNCDPPPSYEEIANQNGIRRIETANHLDPPPQYEDIVNTSSVNGISVPSVVTSIK